MYILTQAGLLETCADKIFRVQAADLEEMYLRVGYQRHERSYQLKCQYKEYTILCPEFRKDGDDSLPVVIIPEFLVPRRPYPIYVYLYAIDLYSGNPEKGQRWAAEETRKYFGLQSFSHTTLGRALKTLVNNLVSAAEVAEGMDAKSAINIEKMECTDPKEVVEGYSSQPRHTTFPSVRTTEDLRKRATQFLGGKLNQLEYHQSIETGQILAREWFMEYGRFLL